ncbi:DUF7657 domain-containing protein [Flavimobilis rhizosphaerae]
MTPSRINFRSVKWRWLVFPAATIVIFGALVGLDLNGSSMGAISAGERVEGLVQGTPRAIRSDEYQLRTPIAISAALQGFPDRPWIGLTPTDQVATAHGGPALEFATILKPQDWGYLTLGASRGLSWSWWWSFAVSLIGCFALIGTLTRRPGLAAAMSIVATFTPYSAWWSSPPPSLFVGYAALTGAAILWAWRASRTTTWIVWATLGGISASMLVLALYPPWQISLAIVVAAACFGHAADQRTPWRRIASSLAVVGAVVALLVGSWFASHQTTIQAIVGTEYPGQRQTHAGGASGSAFLSAPLNFWLTGPAGGTLGASGGRVGQFANQSEIASSWLPLPVTALVMAGTVVIVAKALRRRRLARTLDSVPPAEDHGGIWLPLAVSAAIAFLTAWSFLPLPDWLGAVTVMDRVQPTRTPLALGFACVLLFGALASSRRVYPAWIWALLIGAAVDAGFIAVLAADRIPWDHSQVNAALVFACGLGLGALFAALLHRRTAGPASVTLALVTTVSWGLVNPLMQGTAPLTNDPLSKRLGEVTAGSSNPRVVAFGDFDMTAKVRAAGLQSISGVTLYPDREVLSALMPGQENIWNNYGQYLWRPAGAGEGMKLEPYRGTVRLLHADPCYAELLSVVDPGWVVSDEQLDRECLEELTPTLSVDGQDVHMYKVVRRS